MKSDGETANNGVRVYVDMVGDLFHAGHVSLLREARGHGDWLVVGVLSDETAESYKRRPIMTLAERVTVIEACRYVDEVVPDAPFEVIRGIGHWVQYEGADAFNATLMRVLDSIRPSVGMKNVERAHS